MLIEMPEYIQKYYTPGAIEYVIVDWNLFVGAAITFFSFTCQASIIPIYSELVNPN